MAWQFLQEAARQRPETLQKVRVIMGNESCDLDSAVSSIVYAFLQNVVAEADPDVGKVIPVLNIPKEDFELKTEVRHFLKKYGVPLDDLFFRNTLDLDVLRSCGSLELILVDHHNLSVEDIWLKPYVIEVIDHRPLDRDWPWENIKKTMEQVGSCSTLIAEIALNQSAIAVPQEVLLLLHGAIILDTACFSENPKKYTAKDVTVLEEIEKRLVQAPGRQTVYKELLSARCDISHLNIQQILKKDLKFVHDIPISSIPILVQDFLDRSGAMEQLQTFARSYQHKCIIILGVCCSENDFKRELAVFAEDKRVLMKLTEALKNSKSPDLQLYVIDKYSNKEKLKIFQQRNTRASRKQILPIVKEITICTEKNTFCT